MTKNKIGITGGIGSGKSYVCRHLTQLGIPIFYTDNEARIEMAENPEIHSQLSTLLGENILQDGKLRKPLLASYICRGASYTEQVNSIVHPFVRQRFRRWAASHSESIICMECALLFESKFDTEVDFIVSISAPLETRIRRVMNRDGKQREEVLRWISLQMPEEEKAKRSDFVLLNDDIHPIDTQISSLLHKLEAR